MSATPNLDDHALQDQEPSSLSYRFWHLATNNGGYTELREPIAVVRHAVAAIRALQGDGFDTASADSLAFVMGLDGNPRYSSPEQRRGAAESSQSLVYSLGVLLFERLTGYHPFADNLGAAHEAGRQLCHVPTDLRSVLHRALAPFPEDRYPDADAFRRALEGHLRNEASRQRRPQTSPPPAPGLTARKLLKALRAPTEVDERKSAAAPAPANVSQLHEVLRAPTEVDAPAATTLPDPATRLTTERDESPAGLSVATNREATDVDPTMFVTRQRRGPLEALARRWPAFHAGLATLQRVPPRLKALKGLEGIERIKSMQSLEGWRDLGSRGLGPVPAWIAAALILFVAVIIWASASDPKAPARARAVEGRRVATAKATPPRPTNETPPGDSDSGEKAPRTNAPAGDEVADNTAPAAAATGNAATGNNEPAATEATADNHATASDGEVGAEATADNHATASDGEVGADSARPRAATFDAALAGERAAHAAAACLRNLDRRRVAIGVTLRFAGDGSTQKVFFGKTTGLAKGERRCLVRSLGEVHGGGPTTRRLVTYTLRFPAGKPVYRIDG